MAWRVVIAGGGFGGFNTARTLEKVVPPYSTRITLINDSNFLLYTPLLPGAAGAALDPRHVIVPLRSLLAGTDLLVGSVSAIDTDLQTVSLERIDGEQLLLEYDQLVLSLGSVSRTLPIPGLAEHGFGLKSLSDATALRNRVLTCLDIAESVEDHSARGRYLGFVFVGAGYAGVEGLAELQDFASQVIGLYPRCRAQGMRWILVEARDQIMPEVPRALSEFAVRELRGRGIEVCLQTSIERITPDEVTFAGGEVIGARTVVWTAGVRPSPVVSRLGLDLDQTGRIITDSTHARAGPAEHLGDRRLRCRAGPGPQGPALSADCPARDPPGQARWPGISPPSREAAVCGGSATRRKACSPNLGTTKPSRSRSACAGVACRPGFSPAATTW